MEMKRKEYLIRLIEEISDNKEEQEIIQYGLHQVRVILINVLTLVISGILWQELSFTLLVFLELFFLRPYAGGYHADTELGCYLISILMMNIIIFLKKGIVLSNMLFIGSWLGTSVFIWLYAPVENPIRCLDKDERKMYANKTKKILLCNATVLLIGIFVQRGDILEVVIWAQIIIIITMVAGLWKYREC